MDTLMWLRGQSRSLAADKGSPSVLIGRNIPGLHDADALHWWIWASNHRDGKFKEREEHAIEFCENKSLLIFC